MLDSIYKDCLDILKPENGHAESAIQGSLAIFAKTKFKRAKMNELDSIDSKDITLDDISDGYICDFPDKMIYLAKEMKSFASNDKAENMDPFLAGHLNLDTIENFTFKDPAKEEEDLFNEESKLAPGFRSKVREEEKLRAGNKNAEEKMKKLKALRQTVHMPSLLFFYCNMVEIVRLREELIKAVIETNILDNLYKRQCKFAGKSGAKTTFPSPIV